MESTFTWLVLFAAGFGYEVFTLSRRGDRHEPLTYHLRRLLRRPWFLVLGACFWVWLPGHLFGWWP